MGLLTLRGMPRWAKSRAVISLLALPAVAGEINACKSDTGATECSIDSLVAVQLNLPVVDKRPVGGIGGQQMVDMHLAQI
jgi:hypothetical protein